PPLVQLPFAHLFPYTTLFRSQLRGSHGLAGTAGPRNEAKTRVPLGRRGDAWDVAYAALFLASDEAKYVTGTEILVDGGLMARSADRKSTRLNSSHQIISYAVF